MVTPRISLVMPFTWSDSRISPAGSCWVATIISMPARISATVAPDTTGCARNICTRIPNCSLATILLLA
jgi:hypothetical protein